MKRQLIIVATLLLLVLFAALATHNRPTAIHPIITVEAPLAAGKAESDNTPRWFKITYILDAVANEQRCEALNGNVARSILTSCPFCAVKQLNCSKTLDPEQQLALSTAPVNTPSGKISNGVILYEASHPELAQTACNLSAEQSRKGKTPITCFKAGVERPKLPAQKLPPSQLGMTFLVFLAALSASWLCCWLIIKYERLHAHFSHDHVGAGPQKFHVTPTPRIGGLGLAAGLVAAGSVMIVNAELTYEREFGLLLLASAPAFFGGLIEDITKRVGVLERLLLTMLAGAVAAWLLGSTLNRVDIPYIDDALVIPLIGVLFTIFAVGGVANAINIIDGYNGLASGYAFLVLAAMSWVAWLLGDTLILSTTVALAGAVLGFMRWNWPGGKLFLGDGGAYLLGFMLAEIAVLIVIRNPEVSPWFSLSLLVYPVFETFYSMYRRKIRAGTSPGQPDGMHLHQLIYKRIAKPEECRLAHNSRVAKYFWIPIALVALLATSYSTTTSALLIISLAWCVVYVLVYRAIVHKEV